jgi:hypothetical protein
LADEIQYRVPDRPRLGSAIRDALSDFYFNSWRLVPANLVWGVGLLGVLFLLTTIPLLGWAGLVILALPTAGLYRMSAMIVRGQPVALSDAWDAWRDFLRPALVVGFALTLGAAVLLTNVLVGFGSVEPAGWAFGTVAGWGLVAMSIVALPLWPLLVDPVRDGVPLVERLRLAATVVLVSPGQFAVLLVVVAVLLATSVILFAALLTITMAYVALLSARFTLPAADRLEGRHTQAIPG